MTNENAIKWLKDLLKSDLPMEQYQTALEKGIEALEQRTGHWIRHDNGKYHWYLCSCCDAMAGSDERMMTYRYCPNCGAKMESEVRNADSN